MKIRDYFMLMAFMVLDMDTYKVSPLILGHSFLSTTDANIDVGAGEIHLDITDKT